MATSYADFLKENPNYVGNANVAATKPKQKGRGGFLSSIISELGGAGGAAGGAAAGAALGSVVPGIGTLIGGIAGGAIGGFGGGTVGRGIENKVRDNQNFFGAGGSAKTAFGEGALSGALGGAGSAASAIRGVKAAGGLKGLKAATGGGDALAEASKAILKGGKKAGLALAGDTVDSRLLSGASRLESRALGFGQGEKIAGQQVKPKDIKDLFAVMKTEGIKSGHPDVVGKQVANRINKVGSAIDAALTNANRPLTSAEQNFIKKGFSTEVANDIVLSSDAAAQKLANKLGTQIGKISSLEDLVKARRAVQDGINFARNAAVAEPAKEKVFLLAQGNLNKLASSISPELKALNGRFAGLSKLEEATLNASKNLTSQSRSAMAGLAGSLKAGDTATALKSSIGSAGRGLADVLGGRTVTGGSGLAKSMATRGVANNMFMPAEQPQDAQGMDAMPTDAAYTETPMQSPDMMQQEQMPQYTLQQALSEAYQLAPKASESELLSYAKALMAQNETQAGGNGGLNVTKPTSEKYAQANAGIQALTQLEQLLSSDPGVLSRTRTPGRGINTLGIGSTIKNATGTGEFDTLGFAVVDNMLRIATGAAAPDTEIRRYMNQYLPAAGDSPATLQTKLNALRQQFNSILDLANGPQTQQTNGLSDAIGNLGGAY